jgi:hypothetical protein
MLIKRFKQQLKEAVQIIIYIRRNRDLQNYSGFNILFLEITNVKYVIS